MELTRRTFGKLLLGALVTVLAGAWGLGRRFAPVGFVRAVRAKFPGKLRRLDEAAVRQPAKWRG
ncbi:MAG: hypothetical protein HYV36_03425 [Lentisphaerae bacterium]|nr:hypothetical protein [Lentisphaerota bacterium]